MPEKRRRSDFIASLTSVVRHIRYQASDSILSRSGITSTSLHTRNITGMIDDRVNDELDNAWSLVYDQIGNPV